MKIVVIGGTGLIGSKLVERLRGEGHQPLAASPRSGVNALTGHGLDGALEGAQVVVDVSNTRACHDAAALRFFQASSRNLLAAEPIAWERRPGTAELTAFIRGPRHTDKLGGNQPSTGGQRSGSRDRKLVGRRHEPGAGAAGYRVVAEAIGGWEPAPRWKRSSGPTTAAI